MVRGNWQKRVESAEARRLAQKQRKHQSEARRWYKQWIQDLLIALDRYPDHYVSKKSLRFWTDEVAANAATDINNETDTVEEQISISNNCGKKLRKNRSTSMGEELVVTSTVMGRSRSNSHVDNTSHSKKKVHPRSKEASENSHRSTNELSSPELYVCRSFFFTGHCDRMSTRGSGRKSGGCRFLHGSDTLDDQTLFQIVSTAHKATQELEQSENAALQAMDDDFVTHYPGAMERLFLQEISLDSLSALRTKEQSEGASFLSNYVTETLASKHLKLSNIVYLCIDDILIYDRYRQGNIFESERFLLGALAGDGAHQKLSFSVLERSADTQHEIPGTALEHILTFLPDEAVATLSSVCKPWFQEIGKTPHLWKHLLSRRNWPYPTLCNGLRDECEDIKSDSQDRYRKQFLQHYSVCRDLKAIKKALGAIAEPRKTLICEREMAYQDFSNRKSAPVSRCVGLSEWSPNRLLAAYAEDCSLRLYEASARLGSSKNDKMCRELVCQRVDPYRNTKRRKCEILSMGLDDQCVGCLCRVMGNASSISASILVVISREDLLLGESSEAPNAVGSFDDISALNVIDIGEAVLNYLLCSDEGDQGILDLLDFLSEGNDGGEVEVNVSPKLAACGYGRFMIEASISIPIDPHEGSDLHMIDRKLFLFSASVGAIVWMGESHPLLDIPRHNEDMNLTELRRPQHASGSRPVCLVAVTFPSSPAIMIGEIEMSGEVSRFELMEGTILARNDLIDGLGWEIRRSPSGVRPIVVTNTDIIAADTAVNINDERLQRHKTVLSFYPRHSSHDKPTFSTMSISGGLEVAHLSCIRDHYVILVCQRLKLQAAPAHAQDDGFEAIDGHWFGNMDEDVGPTQGQAITDSSGRAIIEFIVVHIPSRSEICRMDVQCGVDIPLLVDDGGDTIGASLSPRGGIVMTGSDVRSLHEEADLVILDDLVSARSTKKKKKLQPNRNGKKDGFARGMSLRG